MAGRINAYAKRARPLPTATDSPRPKAGQSEAVAKVEDLVFMLFSWAEAFFYVLISDN
ncbi:hypothetical protein THICB2_220033 [Thiomonas sp. CB2]|nr:hypothetical protein THICB2_220033 [Thiomonas sp. CB2]